MTFYPTSPAHETVFSHGRYGDEATLMFPTDAFWHWLVASGMRWQMRGELKLADETAADFMGGEAGAALAAEDLSFDSASVWAGAGGTRTPMHVDWVHGIVFQIAGTKRLFLTTQGEVADAVEAGKLPAEVLDSGNTEDFCREGSLDDVHGLNRPEPAFVGGEVATLRAGDCLLLPAGLYHDVQSEEGAAFSITVRFGFQHPETGAGCGCKDPAPAASPSRECTLPAHHLGEHHFVDTMAQQMFAKWRLMDKIGQIKGVLQQKRAAKAQEGVGAEVAAAAEAAAAAEGAEAAAEAGACAAAAAAAAAEVERAVAAEEEEAAGCVGGPNAPAPGIYIEEAD
jgi:hypothetical protein